MAGAFTESTVIGTAGQTIDNSTCRRPKARLLNNIPVAYAVSYLVGTGFVVWFLSSLAPRLLQVNLKDESRKLEATLASGEGHRTSQHFGLPRVGHASVSTRAMARASAARWREFETTLRAPDRVFVERVRQGARDRGAEAGHASAAGRRRGIAARRHVMLGGRAHDRRRRSMTANCSTSRWRRWTSCSRTRLADRPLGEVADDTAAAWSCRSSSAAGRRSPSTRTRCSIAATCCGSPGHRPTSSAPARRSATSSGRRAKPTWCSSASASFSAALFGLLTFDGRRVPLRLTASGGALVMGLVFGWLRSVRPTFGRIPEPALWVFDTDRPRGVHRRRRSDAGPSFVTGLRRWAEPAGGRVRRRHDAARRRAALRTLRPEDESCDPLRCLRGCGHRDCRAAIDPGRGGQQAAVLGYTVPYAIGNILLTAWGPVIVMLTQ